MPSTDVGSEAAYARAAVVEALRRAPDELPTEQREVFIAHELDGRSFKEMAAESGVGVNMLLSRKHYAGRALAQAAGTSAAELMNHLLMK